MSITTNSGKTTFETTTKPFPMNSNRRHIIGTALAGGCTHAPSSAKSTVNPIYALLDEILAQPVFKREFFPQTDIIDTLELLRFNNSFLCRVRSKDGAEGLYESHT